MKISAIIPAVLALSAVSFGSFAATEVQHSTQAPVGVVSVSDVDTLADVTAALSKKLMKLVQLLSVSPLPVVKT